MTIMGPPKKYVEGIEEGMTKIRNSNVDIRVLNLLMDFSLGPTHYPIAFRKCPQ